MYNYRSWRACSAETKKLLIGLFEPLIAHKHKAQYVNSEKHSIRQNYCAAWAHDKLFWLALPRSAYSSVYQNRLISTPRNKTSPNSKSAVIAASTMSSWRGQIDQASPSRARWHGFVSASRYARLRRRWRRQVQTDPFQVRLLHPDDAMSLEVKHMLIEDICTRNNTTALLVLSWIYPGDSLILWYGSVSALFMRPIDKITL